MRILKFTSLEFVELINEKQSNCIVGVIYRHPTMDTSQFTDKYNIIEHKFNSSTQLYKYVDYTSCLDNSEHLTPDHSIRSQFETSDTQSKSTPDL